SGRATPSLRHEPGVALSSWSTLHFHPVRRAAGAAPDVRDDGTHTNINETVDANVFKRWRADPTYRPQNLVEWAKRKNVDPGQLQSSVRADDPSVAVPDP
ncbi:hypothetical protein ACVI7B_008051, partial [Bradyrhizobium elkanii]